MFNVFGGVAQLGERLHGMQEVRGSIPLVSTISDQNKKWGCRMLRFQPVMLNLIQHPVVQRCTMGFRIGSGMTSYLLTCDSLIFVETYIIVVNPVFLVQAGIPQEAAIISTVFAAAFSTIIVGLRANLPFVIIPGMGLNACFLYHLVGDIGLTWQTALGVNFLAGLGYYLLSVSGISFKIAMAVPQNLKAAIVGWHRLVYCFPGYQERRLDSIRWR